MGIFAEKFWYLLGFLGLYWARSWMVLWQLGFALIFGSLFFQWFPYALLLETNFSIFVMFVC